jgi:hypothetical protein
MDVLHVYFHGGYGVTVLEHTAMFCALGDAILCSIYSIQGLLVDALLCPMITHYFSYIYIITQYGTSEKFDSIAPGFVQNVSHAKAQVPSGNFANNVSAEGLWWSRVGQH